MKLTFVGAAHEVTGSCYFLEACGQKFLIDYGMEQGQNIYENVPLPVPAADVDFVLLTHAHIDHAGLLPKLYADGFRGRVYATEATVDLCNIMLRDSAHIQEFEAEWHNRKGRRAGQEEYIPLYTMQDAIGVIGLMQAVPYAQRISPAEGIDAEFADAGHLLGSASISVSITEEGITRKLVFSGDIGNLNQPLIKDPTYLTEADYIIMESTYGDRLHAPVTDYVTELAKVIQRTFDRGGNVVIPSFAVGRTQEMLNFIRQIKEEGLVKGHGEFEVVVDSPLAVSATGIFDAHYTDCFDEEARALIAKGINPIRFPGLKMSITAEESKEINLDQKPKVILSASGMCDAGRIKHHLKHNLWRKESTVLFVGYQANGTLGRMLVEGAEQVKLFGEEIVVSAEISVLPGISGHADQAGLLKWAGSFREYPVQKVFVAHGDDSVTDFFAGLLHEQFGYQTMAPFSGCVFDLAANAICEEPSPVRIAKHAKKPAQKRANAVFARLLGAGTRLLALIRNYEGGANKDLAKFTDQIHSLCDKWEKK